MKNKKIVALSGSLRKHSGNTAILNILSSMAKVKAVEFEIYEGLDNLPFFSPEIDNENVQNSVKEFRNFLKNSNGIIICTPEYAFGVPGVLKNALDWLVSSAEFYEKPVATISASPTPMGGDKAHESLRHTMTALGANMIEGGMLIIPFVRVKMDKEGNVTDPSLRESLEKLLNVMIKNL